MLRLPSNVRCRENQAPRHLALIREIPDIVLRGTQVRVNRLLDALSEIGRLGQRERLDAMKRTYVLIKAGKGWSKVCRSARVIRIRRSRKIRTEPEGRIQIKIDRQRLPVIIGCEIESSSQ